MPNRTPTPARPVFVDRSGRRRRLAAMIGAALGVALVATLAAFAVGLSSGSPLSIPGLPDIGSHGGATTTSPDAPAHLRTLPPPGRPSASATATSGTEPTPTPTLRRRVPTHTPPHTPKPK